MQSICVNYMNIIQFYILDLIRQIVGVAGHNSILYWL